MKSLTLLSTLLLIFFFTINSASAAKTGEISGQVIEQETMNPVAFAEVTLESSLGKVVLLADEYGHYSASLLPVGIYHASIHYNQRTFVTRIHVMENFFANVNLLVSSNKSLPETNTVEQHKSLPVFAENLKLQAGKQGKTTSESANSPITESRNKKLYVLDTGRNKMANSGMEVLTPPLVDPE